jgi:DNA-binding transcriptional LysR family regulator
VRVSTGECAAGFLARCLSGPTTTALPSGITLELVDSRQTANLARREADMALRHQPPETGGFYSPSSMARRKGYPAVLVTSW